MIIGGIYEILNTANGKRYIGQASNFDKRWKEHQADLRADAHHSVALQRAWNKYGEAVFQFQIAMLCPNADLTLWEQRFFDEFSPEYNICKVAGSSLGVKHSVAARERMSAGKVGNTNSLGFKHPPEFGAQMSARLMGNTHGRGLLGIKRSSETCERMSKAQIGNTKFLGRTHTPEQCVKISARLIGNVNGRGNLGGKHTPEHRAKNSAVHKGKTPRLGAVLSVGSREKIGRANRRVAAYKRLMACQGALA